MVDPVLAFSNESALGFRTLLYKTMISTCLRENIPHHPLNRQYTPSLLLVLSFPCVLKYTTKLTYSTTTQLTSCGYICSLLQDLPGLRIVLFHTSTTAFLGIFPILTALFRWVDTAFLCRAVFCRSVLQSNPRGFGPTVDYALTTNKRSGFKPLRSMRYRAHLFVSTRLGNVFTVAMLIHDY